MVWHAGIAQYRGPQSNVWVAQVCRSKAVCWEASGAAVPDSQQPSAAARAVGCPRLYEASLGELGNRQLWLYLPPQQKVTPAKCLLAPLQDGQ